jgi:hypothetical protein
MINQGRLTPENRQAAIDTLKQMAACGKTKNIMVGAEPRNDSFTLLTEVLTSAGAYANPDVGNFGGDQPHQHAGIRAMFPHTDGNCHMKILNPAIYDLAAAIQLTKELVYKGLYSPVRPDTRLCPSRTTCITPGSPASARFARRAGRAGSRPLPQRRAGARRLNRT